MPIGSRGRAIDGAAGWVPPGLDDGGGDGGGSGTAGAQYYTDGPPTRSDADNPTIVYNGGANGWNSLQEAYEALQPDQTLYIDPANDPYSERLNLGSNPTDHITIASDGQLSVNADQSINQDTAGAIVKVPNDNDNFGIGANRAGFTSRTSISGSHNTGSALDGTSTNAVEWLSVNDASAFSVGDVIYIQESRVPYGEPSDSGGAYHPDTTDEVRRIEEIDGNDLRLNYQLLLPYPNNNATDVGHVQLHATDVRITGIVAEGTSTSSGNTRPLFPYSIQRLWMDNIVVQQSEHQSVHLAACFRPRLDKVLCRNGSRYAVNGTTMVQHGYFTDIHGDNVSRYVVRIAHAGSGRGSCDQLIDGIRGDSLQRTVGGMHFGGFHADYKNMYSGGSQINVCRSRHHNVTNIEKSGTISEGADNEFVCAQRPFDCTISNATVTDTSGVVFFFRCRTGSESGTKTSGDEYPDHITYEDIDITTGDGTSPSNIGSFEGTAGAGNLTFHNVKIDGTWLEESHVQSWSGYSDNNPTLTVTHD